MVTKRNFQTCITTATTGVEGVEASEMQRRIGLGQNNGRTAHCTTTESSEWLWRYLRLLPRLQSGKSLVTTLMALPLVVFDSLELLGTVGPMSAAGVLPAVVGA